MSLHEAPLVSKKPQWNRHSFLHVERKLRQILDTYSTAALIFVFGTHFGVTTHVVNDQADSYIMQFKAAFGNIAYLQPLGWYNSKGENMSGSIRKDK